ncbi:hypothetical protein A6U86_33200 [Rhizobium sp. AC27/96]|nr:hypothetical protein A6U86_33200 [Rhizobium sp. AC27/96]
MAHFVRRTVCRCGPFYAGDVPLGWGEVDDGESIRAIHRAADLGIRVFDTASNYGAGHSEKIVGKAIGVKLRNDLTHFSVLR